jgi:hypothetical protein
LDIKGVRGLDGADRRLVSLCARPALAPDYGVGKANPARPNSRATGTRS